VHTIIKLMSD